MEIQQEILENFKDVEKVSFEKEDSLLFLRVYTKLHSMEDITKLSKEINDFVDQNDKSDKQYYLDIVSKGTDTKIEIDDLKKEIEKNIYIELSNSEKYIGILKEVNEDDILVRYNAKGQFRKKTILKKDIMLIKKWAIIKKEK